MNCFNENNESRTATQPQDSFTIQWTTTQTPPNFPNFPGFPFRKRDVVSPDEQLDGRDHDSNDQ